MDFSLTTMFVLPQAMSWPATGSTEHLLPKQFGIFSPGYQLMTAASVVGQPYIYLAQGRFENTPGVGSKRSNKIAKNKVVSWYKVSAEPDEPTQSTIVSDFKVSCGEQVTVTIRAHSNYLDTGFSNGYTQSVTVEAPCCNCGDDPCSDLEAQDIQQLVDDIIGRFGVSGPFMGSVLNHYIDVSRLDAGANSKLVIKGKPLDKDGKLCDVSANPWEYDRLWYQVFVTKGAASTQDPLTYDRCDQVATVTTTSRAAYVRGSSSEILHMEKYYYSYQSPELKTLVNKSDYNGAYESYVVDGQFYDTYYLKFLSVDELGTWNSSQPQDESVIIAVPTGQGATLEAILSAFLEVGPTDYSAADRTTTTSTTTTTTTLP